MIIGICGLSGSGKDAAADFLVPSHNCVRVAFADPLKRIAQEVYEFTDEQLWGPSQFRNAPDKRYPRPKHEWVKGGKSGYVISCVCCGFELGDISTFGTDEQVSRYREAPNCYLTPRYSLQLLGTEWGRHCYPNTWANMAIKNAKELLEATSHGRSYFMYTPKNGVVNRTEFCSEGEFERDDAPNYDLPNAVVIPDVRFKSEIEILKENFGKVVRIKRYGFETPKWDHPSETEQLEIPDSEFDYVLLNDGTLKDLKVRCSQMFEELRGHG